MRKLAAGLITCYQLFLSHGLKSVFGGGCRFYPTCSDYAKEAILKKGIYKGMAMALARLLRCHPLTKGGYDPVTFS